MPGRSQISKMHVIKSQDFETPRSKKKPAIPEFSGDGGLIGRIRR